MSRCRPEASMRSPGVQTKNGGPMAAVPLKSSVLSLQVLSLGSSYLISIPLFGQIHFLTSPPWINAFAWIVFTPKIVSAL